MRFLLNWLFTSIAIAIATFLVPGIQPFGFAEAWVCFAFVGLFLNIVDTVFAVDSVPAIFGLTNEPLVVFTSNMFAILGLRALYFALAAMIHRFAYLKYALALVLVFIGSKIFLVNIVGKIPSLVSLGITVGLIAGGVLVSLWKTRGQAAGAVARAPEEALAAPKDGGTVQAQ